MVRITAPRTTSDVMPLMIAVMHSQVPEHLWGFTPVHMMATAGMRMLPQNQSEAVLASCRVQLAISGFQFEPAWARVLPGSLEGLYAWVAVNYAAGSLQVSHPERATSMCIRGCMFLKKQATIAGTGTAVESPPEKTKAGCGGFWGAQHMGRL
jgi:hypothetical protein